MAQVTLDQVSEVPGLVGLDPTFQMGLFRFRQEHPDGVLGEILGYFHVVGSRVFVPSELENLIYDVALLEIVGRGLFPAGYRSGISEQFQHLCERVHITTTE